MGVDSKPVLGADEDQAPVFEKKVGELTGTIIPHTALTHTHTHTCTHTLSQTHTHTHTHTPTPHQPQHPPTTHTHTHPPPHTHPHTHTRTPPLSAHLIFPNSCVNVHSALRSTEKRLT